MVTYMEKGWMLFAVNFSPPLTSNPLSVRALCPLEGSPQPSACPVSYVSYVHLAARTPPSCKACPTFRVSPHPFFSPFPPPLIDTPRPGHMGLLQGAKWELAGSQLVSIPIHTVCPILGLPLCSPPCYYRPPAI